MRLKRPKNLVRSKFTQKIAMLIHKPAFRRRVNQLRNDFNIKFWKNTHRLYHVTTKKFDKEVNKLLEDFNLHPGWFEVIKQYILVNYTIYNPDSPDLVFKDNKVISITIYPDSELVDIVNAQKIAGAKKEGKRFKPWINFNRDNYIYELAKSGKKIPEIYRAIKDGVYKQSMDYKNIENVLIRFQDRMGITGADRVHISYS